MHFIQDYHNYNHHVTSLVARFRLWFLSTIQSKLDCERVQFAFFASGRLLFCLWYPSPCYFTVIHQPQEQLNDAVIYHGILASDRISGSLYVLLLYDSNHIFGQVQAPAFLFLPADDCVCSCGAAAIVHKLRFSIISLKCKPEDIQLYI